VLLLVAVFPANVNAALDGITLNGEPPTSLWLRTPMQILFIGMVLWTSVAYREGRGTARETDPGAAGGTRDAVQGRTKSPGYGP
jgi:uncharacterized membrane protein